MMENQIVYKRIGAILKEKRKQQNVSLTKVDIATYIGITQQQLSKYENGENKIPIYRLYKICDLLNIDLKTIIKQGYRD